MIFEDFRDFHFFLKTLAGKTCLISLLVVPLRLNCKQDKCEYDGCVFNRVEPLHSVTFFNTFDAFFTHLELKKLKNFQFQVVEKHISKQLLDCILYNKSI